MSDKYTFGWTDPIGGVFGMTSPKTEREKVVEAAAVQMELFNLFDDAIKLEYVGSRVTCVPAPTDTDEDVLILVNNVTQFASKCIRAGFKEEGSYAGAAFVSLKLGEGNLIVTEEEEFYDKFMLATHVCKSLNVLDKQHRITVFQAILYGKAYGKP